MNTDHSLVDRKRVSIRMRARKVHVAFKVLPHLERDFSNCLFEISTGKIPDGDRGLAHRMLLEHVSMIRMELSTAFRSLSEIRKWMDRENITQSAFEDAMRTVYDGYSDAGRVIDAIRNAGGAEAYFHRMSKVLLAKHEAYGRCIERIRKTDPSNAAVLGELSFDLFDLAPGNIGVPDMQYSIICLGGPLAWAVTAALVVVVIVVKDDSGRDDPPEPEPDPEDAEGGICVPGDGLDTGIYMCI